jgi:hypothetical protein
MTDDILVINFTDIPSLTFLNLELRKIISLIFKTP